MKPNLKNHLEAKMTSLTPVDCAFFDLPYEGGKKGMAFGRAGKLAFGGGLFAGAMVLAISLLALTPWPSAPFVEESQLSFPTYRSRAEVDRGVPAYETFVRRFVPALFSNLGQERSVSVSLPDLFVSVSLSAYLSGGDIESEFLSYVGLSDEEELLEASSSVFRMLGNLEEKSDVLSGGLLLSSLFLDPVYELRDDEEMDELLQKVADAFGTALFYRSPSDSVLNEYLRSIAPRGASLPKVQLDETFDCLVASTYIGNFFYLPEEASSHKAAYDAGERMAYHLDGSQKEVPYIEETLRNDPYLGSLTGAAVPFEGINIDVGSLASLSCFKTIDENGSPFALISDILGGNYEEKYSDFPFMDNVFYGYYLTVKVPYFKDETDVDFSSTLHQEMPSFGEEGAFLKKILAADSPKATFASSRQQLRLSYDYSGFSVASLSYLGGATATAPSPVRKDLFFDRPFAYVLYEGDSYELPIVVGCIVDPSY